MAFRKATQLLAVILLLACCGRTDPLFPREPVDPGSDAGDASDAGFDAGFELDAGLDAGFELDAGSDAGFELDAGFDAGFDGGTVLDGGFDAGFPLVDCDAAHPCPTGFSCNASGHCELNGSNGPLQITLSWLHDPRLPEDLDLHLDEPTRTGSCEIYYSNKGGPAAACPTVGVLDLDADPACTDNSSDGRLADTENIIYPPGVAAPRGHYVVRVAFWSDCTDAGAVPFTVAVRRDGQTTVYPGTFLRGDDDQTGANSGRTMAEFDVP